jgi:SAM-dependent methyltransferase
MRGPETEKAHARRLKGEFVSKFMFGKGLDIGYRGQIPDAEPVLPDAIGVDLDYPGYDGTRLPFADASQGYVYSSHCLEHILDYRDAIREWFRVVREGGFLIIAVPHQFLYEKREHLPSRWNADHKRFYTPAALLREVEESLPPNAYRIRLLHDCDFDYDYSIPPERHSGGEYQVELVIEKIHPPVWGLDSNRSVLRRGTLTERILRRGTALLRNLVRPG